MTIDVHLRPRAIAAAIALSAAACAPGSKSGSASPALSDYEITVRPGRALAVDPGVTSNGRFQVVPGGKLVLELASVHGKPAIAHDRGAVWSVALELPANPDPGGPMEVTLDGAPAVARVAGDDVLYLARQAHGRIKLDRTSDPVTGEVDIAFDTPDRDLIKLGRYALRGTFKARTR